MRTLVPGWSLRLARTLVAGGLLALPLFAQSHKLVTAPPPGPGGGDVRELLTSPDGTRVVYRADEESYGVVELFSAPADGSSAPVKLNGALTKYGGVAEHGFAISPDGTRVVYRAIQDHPLKTELYSAPIDGSASAVRLSGPIVGDGVERFEISADGSRVVYAADQDMWHRFELYSAPIDGSTSAVRVSGTVSGPPGVHHFHLGAGGRAVYIAPRQLFSVPLDGSAAPTQLTSLPASNQVTEFQLTADGTRAVFVESQSNPVVEKHLWTVPIDGSLGPLRLTPTPLSPFGLEFRISSAGTRAVHLALTSTGVFELFSVPLDGSTAPVRLHPALAADRTVVYGSYDITADGARVVWLADQTDDEVFELWSAPIDASAAAQKLSGALVAGGDVAGVHGVSRVTAGERVVYVADQDTDGVLELYSVPADGSGAVLKLNGPLVSAAVHPYSNDLLASSAPFGADHARAVFALDTFVGSQTITELFSVPVDASAGPVKLNAPLVSGGSVSPGQGWGFEGSHVFYIADQDTDEIGELYGVPLDGAPGLVKLNGPMAPTPPPFRVDCLAFTSDATRVVYALDGANTEISSVPADGSGSPISLSGPLVWRDAILSLPLTPDGSRLAYTDIDSGIGRLYSVPADGSAAPLLLFSWPVFVPGGFLGFELAPDSDFAVCRANEQLFRVTLDGSSSTLALTSPSPSLSQAILSFEISPTGNRVVFFQDREVAGRYELYSVPLDGSSAPVKLNAPLVANGDVLWPSSGAPFVISPDGSRVVYQADQDVDMRVELYSVPIAGGTPVKLNGPIVGGGVRSFDIAPDGARVAYVADQEVSSRYELYSVPLTGGSPVKLNGALVSGGSISGGSKGFAFSPASTRVLYVADQDVNDRFELYSVLATGGASVKLNGSLAPGSGISIQTVRFSADSRNAVFLADDEVENVYELFSRRINGSGKVTKLNSPLPAGGSVQGFALSPDGQQVVYVAEQEADDRRELYAIPVRGGTRRKLNGPLVARGYVWNFEISPDGRRVVYSADQDTENVTEIYESNLRVPVAPAAPTKSGPKPPSTVTVVH
ncbi:MAG: hypothetical protein HOP15_07820 [Planctomycetes bacterium]|nr:hypothetical protein [Planctomycetota bacterium]